MCKLSLHIVPNVYNSPQKSFLSLAWPWPGMSLPKGNQWECWDPELGPNVVRLPVHLPPQCPYTPYWSPDALYPPDGPLMLPYTPDAPAPLLAPPAPTLPVSPQCTPEIPYTLCQHLMPLHPYQPPISPWCLHLCWSLSPYTPCQPQCTLKAPAPLTAPWCPLPVPYTSWCPLHICWPLSPLHSLPAPQCIPETPTPPAGPLMPQHPLTCHMLPTPQPAPNAHYTSAASSAPTLPDIPQCTPDTPTPLLPPWHPYTPYWLPMLPDAPVPLLSLSPTLPASHPNAPLTPCQPPDTPYIPASAGI